MSLLEKKFDLKPTQVTKEDVKQGVQAWAKRIKLLKQIKQALTLAKDSQFVLQGGLKILEKDGNGSALERTSLTYLPRYLPRESHQEYFQRLFEEIIESCKGGDNNV